MMRYLFATLAFSFLAAGHLSGIIVSPQEAKIISEKVWKNECGGTIIGLTCWNKGESFGSFGIGHFIWYPIGKKERFKETFPELLKFLSNQGVILPKWLKEARGCPWTSREDFYDQFGSQKMTELRQFLFDTKDLQAIFIANQLENVLPAMTERLSAKDKLKINTIFYKLAADPRGLYALIDYLNFKGPGTSQDESYNGEGWGLLQVLQQIDASSTDILIAFVQSAKNILTQRVNNSPLERNEERWIKGWHNRINTYLEPV